jgi:hypothetical protein
LLTGLLKRTLDIGRIPKVCQSASALFSMMVRLAIHADCNLEPMIRREYIPTPVSRGLRACVMTHSSRVDFPAPRYPVKRVIGTFGRSS